jgi:hypothetical protein
MISAGETCGRFWFAGARHFLGPRNFPCPAGALAFLDGVNDPLGPHAPIHPAQAAGGTAMGTWIGRVDGIEPGHDDLHLSV